MESSAWFVTVQHGDNCDTKDIFVDIEDGSGIIDRFDTEIVRNTDNHGCIITISIFTAVAITQEQFDCLRKELVVSVNGEDANIIRQTATDSS